MTAGGQLLTNQDRIRDPDYGRDGCDDCAGGGWVALASDPETVIGGAISSAVGSENEPGSGPKLVDICGSLTLASFIFSFI